MQWPEKLTKQREILRLSGVCFEIFSSSVALESTPVLALFLTAGVLFPTPVPVQPDEVRASTLVLVGSSCPILASPGCPTPLIKLQGKAQPML